MNLIEVVEQHPTKMLVYKSQPEEYPMHKHSIGQLTYFQGGSSHLHTPDSTYFIPTNFVVWIPPRFEHFFSHLQMSKMLTHTFYFPLAKYSSSFYDAVRIFEIHPLLKEVLTVAEAGSHTASTPTYKIVDATIQLLPNLLKNPLVLNLPVSSNDEIKRLIIYINDHLADNLTLSSLSSMLNMGERTFTRLFQKELGITVGAYIKNARIMKSIELILEDRLTLSEIAYEVGYVSLASFSNAFFQLTKMRPSEFRT